MNKQNEWETRRPEIGGEAIITIDLAEDAGPPSVQVYEGDDALARLRLSRLEQSVDALIRLDEKRAQLTAAALDDYSRLDDIPLSLQRTLDCLLRP